MGARLINGKKKKKRLAHRKSRLKALEQTQSGADKAASPRR